MKTYIIAEAGINHNRSLICAKLLADTAKSAGADVVKFQLEHPTEYCLTYEETAELYHHCESIGMPFACTAFDVPTLKFLLRETQMAFVKIASCDALNKELIQVAHESGLPMIQSLRRDAITHFSLLLPCKYLHVVSEYPTPFKHADLARIKEPGISGLSDHSGNPLIPALAVALGASIIECHLTLDSALPGPDHKASLDPKNFRQMVQNVRITEQAMGIA